MNNYEEKKQIQKELKEETGYFGEIISLGPRLKTNPGIQKSDFILAKAEINELLPENKIPKQELEPEEEIEVMLIDKENIPGFLDDEKEKGTDITAGLWLLMNNI